MIDLKDPRLVCPECGGSGQRPKEIRPGVFDLVSDDVPCTCQDDERMVMKVVKPLDEFYWYLVEYCGPGQLESGGIYKRTRLAEAAIALARLCVARGIEPRRTIVNKSKMITLVLRRVLDINLYTGSQLDFWAFHCFHGIYALASQAGIDLDKIIKERLG